MGSPAAPRGAGLRSRHSTRRTGKPCTGGRAAGVKETHVVRYARCETPKPSWESNRHWRAEYSERRKLGSEGGGGKSTGKVTRPPPTLPGGSPPGPTDRRAMPGHPL